MKGGKIRLPAVAALVFLAAAGLSGQSAEEQRLIFVQAESHYLYGEYELANPLYLILDDLMPDNASIKFKIGDCYLNIPDERSKAVSYLEEASRNADAESRPEQMRETKAPLEAWFSLASAYRMNNELDKAINTYQAYLRLITDAGLDANTEFVKQQITACQNAIRLMQEPVDIRSENLGSVVNQGAVNFNPAISYDGNSMVFSENRGLENAIFYTIRERGVWQTPIEITEQLGDALDCHATALNTEGTELYLYKSDNFDGNIYVSTLVNDRWTKIRKLNRNINTKYYESHASISHDGQRLYFTSNRPGGQGELDIYMSVRGSGDNWGKPVNLGATINTPFNENTPFITDDDLMLFFSSEGHTNMGGYDIFRSTSLGQAWKSPENLGYPVNSTDDDLFFQPHNNGNSGFYSLYTGYKNREIIRVDFGTAAGTELYEITGKCSLSSDSIEISDMEKSVSLLNLVRGDTIGTMNPDTISSAYSFEVKTGIYRLIFMGKGHLTETRDTIITALNPDREIRIDVILNPDPDWVPDKPAEPDTVYEKIDMSAIPSVAAIDSSILVTHMLVRDVGDMAIEDDKVLYYTVQVMALHNPVDVSYFRHISDMVVIYNDTDKFYRYTTGKFATREEAYAYRLQLITKGYPDEIFVKKVFRE
ncbi:MAG: hypothetical protein RBS37_02565 [Bacteroidales bacterium]|jgi:tetratricopeptide (TPR) repeat protein|nr:hypothetical protein [Bacteroidales bacterium]